MTGLGPLVQHRAHPRIERRLHTSASRTAALPVQSRPRRGQLTPNPPSGHPGAGQSRGGSDPAETANAKRPAIVDNTPHGDESSHRRNTAGGVHGLERRPIPSGVPLPGFGDGARHASAPRDSEMQQRQYGQPRSQRCPDPRALRTAEGSRARFARVASQPTDPGSTLGSPTPGRLTEADPVDGLAMLGRVAT